MELNNIIQENVLKCSLLYLLSAYINMDVVQFELKLNHKNRFTF